MSAEASAGKKPEPEVPKVSRRKFIWVGAGVALVALAGGGYYLYTTTLPKPKKYLRYLGHPFWLPEDGAKTFRDTNPDIDLETTYADFYVVPQREFANPASWDICGSGRSAALVRSDMVKSIPTSMVPRWGLDKALAPFNKADEFYGPAMAKRFNELLWEGGKAGGNLVAVPNMTGYESQNYLPEFLPYSEKGDEVSMSFEELWNPEWKGHVGLIDEGFDNFARLANYLDYTKQMTFSGAFSSATRDELDKMFNFILPAVKSGQFKSFWSKYGDIMALMSTREIWLSVSWVPISLDCRKAGVPAFHAAIKEGPCFWYNVSMISKQGNPDVFEEAVRLASFHLELPIQTLYAKQLYTSGAPYWDDLKQTMGSEFYEWFHNGAATYEPIDQITKEQWPDDQTKWTLPEGMQQGMLQPDVYFKAFWTGEAPRTGSPHPKGNKRDLGSLKFKDSTTRWFLSPDLPDENDYYVTKWEEIKANVPT
jgi:hypothetical protein